MTATVLCELIASKPKLFTSPMTKIVYIVVMRFKTKKQYQNWKNQTIFNFIWTFLFLIWKPKINEWFRVETNRKPNRLPNFNTIASLVHFDMILYMIFIMYKLMNLWIIIILLLMQLIFTILYYLQLVLRLLPFTASNLPTRTTIYYL